MAATLVLLPGAELFAESTRTKTDVLLAGVLTVVLPVIYLFVRGMSRALYDEAEKVSLINIDFDAHVARLNAALARAAEGDLAAAAASTDDVVLSSDGSMADLAAAMGRTVESLRGLVGSVRVGGESIGSAASQVLVAAREQAASASEQSSAVAETTATIEELAATAAQIAETSGQVAVFASETLGFAEAGSGGGGGVGCGDGFDCVAGGSDCGAGVGVGAEGSGDWSDFGGD